MKHVKYKPDITEWKLDAIEEVNEAISSMLSKALSEALHLAFENDETYIYFPVEWGDRDGIGGPGVSDPLTVYLCVGLESDENKPTYEFNLRDALMDSIKGCAEHGSFSSGLGRLSESFRALADEIDTALANHSQKKQ
jgi:hypothetical protein